MKYNAQLKDIWHIGGKITGIQLMRKNPLDLIKLQSVKIHINIPVWFCRWFPARCDTAATICRWPTQESSQSELISPCMLCYLCSFCQCGQMFCQRCPFGSVVDLLMIPVTSVFHPPKHLSHIIYDILIPVSTDWIWICLVQPISKSDFPAVFCVKY